MSANISLLDPFESICDLLEALEDARDNLCVEEDEYRPLAESDEALRRAVMLMQQALEILRGVSEVELPRFQAAFPP